MSENEAPGWDAITAAAARVHGKQQPLHWAPQLPAALGGPDPLNGISVYRADGPAHWHYVTYGFSELYAKESDDTAVSGFGFELTFRLTRGAEDQPSPWPLNFLQNLARYVFKTGNIFEPGHHMHLNGPIALGQPTAIVAVMMVLDPQLGIVETPNGRLAFVQVVGITKDEWEASIAWDTHGMAKLMAARDPLLITDLARTSHLADTGFAYDAAAGTERDGSSTSALFSGGHRWHDTSGTLHLTVGALIVSQLKTLLRYRIPYGRPLAIVGNTDSVRFEPANTCSWEIGDKSLTVRLTSEAARELSASLAPKKGLYSTARFPGLQLTVEPSSIKDAAGKVVETIGE